MLDARYGFDAPRWRLAVPESGRARGLVVALHGAGGNADDAFGHGYDRSVAATGLALVSADGARSCWHARADGTDGGAMVRDAPIPLALSKAGLPPTTRVGLLGWSMGGFGALLLASDLGPTRVTGVVAASAALWLRGSDTPARAYDGREDFDRNSTFNRVEKRCGSTAACPTRSSAPTVRSRPGCPVSRRTSSPAGTSTRGGPTARPALSGAGVLRRS